MRMKLVDQSLIKKKEKTINMKVFALSLTALLATAAAEPIVHGKDCAPCSDTEGECVVKTMINLHAGETGK